MRRFLIRAPIYGSGEISQLSVIVTNPSAPGQNTIQPVSDNVEGLTIKGHSATQSADLQRWFRFGDTGPVSFVLPDGSFNVGGDGAPGDNLLQVTDGIFGSGGITIISCFKAGIGFAVNINSAADGDVPLQVFGTGSTQTADIFQVYDKHQNLAFSVKTDGSIVLGEAGGKMGCLGALPVVRQVGASAAGIAAITDANAKAAISALQTALANLGLVTSPA